MEVADNNPGKPAPGITSSDRVSNPPFTPYERRTCKVTRELLPAEYMGIWWLATEPHTPSGRPRCHQPCLNPATFLVIHHRSRNARGHTSQSRHGGSQPAQTSRSEAKGRLPEGFGTLEGRQNQWRDRGDLGAQGEHRRSAGPPGSNSFRSRVRPKPQ